MKRSFFFFPFSAYFRWKHMLFPKSSKSEHWIHDFLQAKAHPLFSKSVPEAHLTHGFSCIAFNSDGINSSRDFCSLHIISLSPSLCSWVSEYSPCWMLFPIPLKEMGFCAAPCVMGPQFLLAIAIAIKQGVPSKLSVLVTRGLCYMTRCLAPGSIFGVQIVICTFYDCGSSWITCCKESTINCLNIYSYCCITNTIPLGLTEEKPLGEKSLVIGNFLLFSSLIS